MRSAGSVTKVDPVYWLEQSETDVPQGDEWLNPSELVRVNSMHVPKRRSEWRLGRWTAKRAIACYLNRSAGPQDFAAIEIHPAWSGAPEASISNVAAPLTISLSHRQGMSLCAIAAGGVDLGCDLEMVESREDAFVRDYFTSQEQQAIEHAPASERFRLVTLLWSAKESVLKALHEGLRLDTRSVVVSFESELSDVDDWMPLRAQWAGGRNFQGWWRESGGLVRTVVMNPPSKAPERLQFRSVFESGSASEKPSG